MASTRGVTLQPYFQDRYVAHATEGFRWRVEAAEAREMPTAIFLYKKVATKLYDPGTGGGEPPEDGGASGGCGVAGEGSDRLWILAVLGAGVAVARRRARRGAVQ